MVKYLIRAVFAGLGLWLAAKFVPGIVIKDTTTLVIAAFVIFLTLFLTLFGSR